MCGMLGRSGTAPFRRISRSIRLDGHATSIQLEAAFWEVLDAIAVREGVTTPRLLAALHEESAELHGVARNFASTLRTLCLLHQGGEPD